MNKAVIPEESDLLIVFSDQFTLSMIFMVSHVAFIGVSIFFVDDGIGAVTVVEGALQSISLGVEDLPFSVLPAQRIYFSLIVTAVEIADLGTLSSHD